jgi:hypothetical protein
VRTPVRTSLEESRLASGSFAEGGRAGDPEFLTVHVLKRVRETDVVLDGIELEPERAS